MTRRDDKHADLLVKLLLILIVIPGLITLGIYLWKKASVLLQAM
jgi:hypothetical protein